MRYIRYMIITLIIITAFVLMRPSMIARDIMLPAPKLIPITKQASVPWIAPTKHLASRSESHKLKMLATAYTASPEEGTADGRTATGIKVRRGIVAVDPKVIPLGTKLYIEGYGEAVAADTGGAIKGNMIDLFMHSKQEALRWGRRWVVVTVY